LQEWILRIVVVCSKGQLFPTQMSSFIHTHPNVREDHVVILMRFFLYVVLHHTLLPQAHTHTGDPCIQILHSWMLGAVITRDTQCISFNSPFKISELPWQACHQVSQTGHPVLVLKLHNLFEGQHANVCYAIFDHENFMITS
jgi:hypothetical protein